MAQEPKTLTSVHTIDIENDTGWKRLKNSDLWHSV